MAEMEGPWLSVDAIDRHLGVSSSDTVYRWIDKHAMPAHRMGRLSKFKKDEADRNKKDSDK
ncbi:MAG: excisionase family DNA-binding protein [Desulfobacterales bacterium]|nr:excisionase family DNA-binding protein [Desulfobacterales bacterium]MDD4071399.1 excisionase family DNA-binding protein [Desulfobacterales bacterium]MDD4391444.1 excisionase family DNA-binding protein [Desulfobacterales bacterium]